MAAGAAPPSAGEPEQTVNWRAMTEQTGWTDRFRDATWTALDRMAWTAIRDLLPGIEREQAPAPLPRRKCIRPG